MPSMIYEFSSDEIWQSLRVNYIYLELGTKELVTVRLILPEGHKAGDEIEIPLDRVKFVKVISPPKKPIGQSKPNKPKTNLADILPSLLDHPRTCKELSDLTGRSDQAVYNALIALEESGIVVKERYVGNLRGFKSQYRLANDPLALPSNGS
jgi:DNA-binding transcriptional ArsR family regulator